MYASDIRARCRSAFTSAHGSGNLRHRSGSTTSGWGGSLSPGKSTMKREDPDSLYKVTYAYINSHGKDMHGDTLGKYSFMGLGIPWGLTCMTPTTAMRLSVRAGALRSNREFIFPGKIACVMKMIMSMPMES